METASVSSGLEWPRAQVAMPDTKSGLNIIWSAWKWCEIECHEYTKC